MEISIRHIRGKRKKKKSRKKREGERERGREKEKYIVFEKTNGKYTNNLECKLRRNPGKRERKRERKRESKKNAESIQSRKWQREREKEIDDDKQKPATIHSTMAAIKIGGDRKRGGEIALRLLGTD